MRCACSAACTGSCSRVRLRRSPHTSRRPAATATWRRRWSRSSTSSPIRLPLSSTRCGALPRPTKPVARSRSSRACSSSPPTPGCPSASASSGPAVGSTCNPTPTGSSRAAAGWGDPRRPCDSSTSGTAACPRSTRRLSIAERRGCDRDPVDVSTDDGEPHAALVRVAAAPEDGSRGRGPRSTRGARRPVVVDAVPIADWVPAQVCDPVPGHRVVVMHSVVWQYLDDDPAGRDRRHRRRPARRPRPTRRWHGCGSSRRVTLLARRAAARPLGRTGDVGRATNGSTAGGSGWRDGGCGVRVGRRRTPSLAGVTILVAGATGYIGGRLVPRLLDEGHVVRCLTRRPEKLDGVEWAVRAGIVPGDVLDVESVAPRWTGSTSSTTSCTRSARAVDFEESDRAAAENVAAAAAAAGVRRIVYLGGLVPTGEAASPHLASRAEVGQIFLDGPVPAVVLQAGVIIGSGSASFEMLRYLTERLPVMVTPKWVRSRATDRGAGRAVVPRRRARAAPRPRTGASTSRAPTSSRTRR